MNDAAIMGALIAQIKAYRWKFLDIARAAGEDLSEIDHPDQIVHPTVEDVALGAVKQLASDYDECLKEERMGHCPEHPCLCGRSASSASMAIGTPRTSSNRTGSRVSVIADTPLSSRGTTPPEYLDILADLGTMLAGEDTDETPMMRLACQAIEYELAERMLDSMGND